ncbi:MAG TPA: hypothetical protein VFR60_03370 [Sphingomicrobium sp.]|nr:hypothetical protein [Sphingomicrobium sp.]
MHPRDLVAALAAISIASSANAQVPRDQLLKPPADARQFVILSSVGPHGSYSTWTMPDGTLAARQSMLLRGLTWELDQTTSLGPNGLPTKVEWRFVACPCSV